jgi:preprotein translocase subunit SecB
VREAMHISVEGIYLSSMEYSLNLENVENLTYELHVRCKSNFFDDGRLIQVLDFDVTHGIKNPPFNLKFSFTASYRSDGEGEPTLMDFSHVNAPAYIVPYARELIANITSRAGVIPTLVIPPINILQLIEEGLHESDEETLGLENFLPEKE